MLEYFQGLSAIYQALIGGTVAWFMTSLGAATVFLFGEVNRRFVSAMLGFAAGVMIAASFWSLLAPSIEMSAHLGSMRWFPPLMGFVVGGVLLRIIDTILPHIHPSMNSPEGIKTKWHRSTLLVLSITLHNIPEGLAIGVAFGAAAYGLSGATLAAAMVLAAGIAVQDYPEGFSVAMPLKGLGQSTFKSFIFGMLSGIVEPIMAVAGAAFVIMSKGLLPYALSFAAGAMLFVTVEEVIPESQGTGNSHLPTTGFMIGFGLMMILETAFT